MKKIGYMAAMLSVSLVLAACSDMPQTTQADIVDESSIAVQTNSDAESDSLIDVDTVFSNRDLSGEYDEEECEVITLSDSGAVSDSEGVEIASNTVTINKEGTYLINGSMQEGMIIVEVDKSEKVQLVLNGVDITSSTSAPIYVRQADKVFITLADGTENTLTNGGEFAAIDDNNIDAVIFSKDDLTLNGSGSLVISSPAGHGIVSKNDLVITNGTYHITAASHGLSGKESVAIADGSFDITAGKDGIHSEDDDDDTVGHVYIEDGSFLFTVESDGISAINEILIAGGSLTVAQSYEGLEARVIHISGGNVDITSSDDGLNATDKRTASSQTESAGGGRLGGDDVQEEASINISGGVIRINAEGDGIDSNGYIVVSGGEVYVAGSSGGGDGALDYGISATISGGIVVAAGQSGMAANFCDGSTQGAILLNAQTTQQSGTDIVLLDSDGNELIQWTMMKGYDSAVVSCPEIVDGGTYTLKLGTEETQITMDGLIYGETAGMGGFGGGHGGMKGGGRGEAPNGEVPDGKLPDGETPNGELPNGEQPNGKQPRGEMPNGERPNGEQPNGEMPQNGERRQP